MKRLLFFISVVTLITLSASCDSTPSSNSETVYLDDALLWRISGNNLPGDSYLLGTLHILPVSFLDSIPIVSSVMHKTDCFMTEVDINSKPSIFSGARTLDVSKALLPSNIKYSDLYSVEDYYLLDDLLYRRGLGHLDKIRLSPIILLCLLYLPEGNGNHSTMLESFLVQQAIASGKDVLYLETMEEQLKALSTYYNSLLGENISVEEQAKGLLEYVKRYSTDSLYTVLYDKYINHKLSEIDIEPEMNEILNSKRNKKWIPKIVRQIKHKPTFIFVGVRHLPGEDGLIYRLKERGYEVTPVK